MLALTGVVLVFAAPGATAAPAGAPTAVAAQLQLRGHLPELGEDPSLRVFLTAEAYDSFRMSAGVENVFPASGSLHMSFAGELLALYARGNDSGGRCLRSTSSASVAGNAVTLNLFWDAGSCGAPPSAHHPFLLVSLSRLADDRSSWVAPGISVCAAAPGLEGTRACAPVTESASPTPLATPAPTLGPTPSPTGPPPTPSPPATPSPSLGITPVVTIPATPAPTRSAPPTASAIALASPAPPSDEGSLLLAVGGWVGLGFVIGVVVVLLLLSSRRDYRL